MQDVAGFIVSVMGIWFGCWYFVWWDRVVLSFFDFVFELGF